MIDDHYDRKMETEDDDFFFIVKLYEEVKDPHNICMTITEKVSHNEEKI